jgi:hypothetical protein
LINVILFSTFKGMKKNHVATWILMFQNTHKEEECFSSALVSLPSKGTEFS